MYSAAKYPCKRIKIKRLYNLLLRTYGPQGWWPLLSKRNFGVYGPFGYHPGKSEIPNKEDIFEIAIGAVLTQNTSWRNVVTAMENMIARKILSPERIISLGLEELADCIKASGYYNQKAKKIKLFASTFFRSSWFTEVPSREELLSLWGIGKETADSILLYGYGKPIFVVDAYTKRLFFRLGYIYDSQPYEEIRDLTEGALTRAFGKEDIFRVYNEFHALIVQQGKTYCKKVPNCETCILSGKG